MKLEQSLILNVCLFVCSWILPKKTPDKTLIVTAFVNINLAEIQNSQMPHRSVERYNITAI